MLLYSYPFLSFFLSLVSHACCAPHSDNTYIEVLDSTRVHPETYEWARKMAVDALEYDEVHVHVHRVVAITLC